ncbi:MAG: hypothetical protein LBB88_02180 [Planctomycetaceae bacterium]|jgi:hypothetical protein|nr:hypothetical protein [Planctomycetaceae bacterium]
MKKFKIYLLSAMIGICSLTFITSVNCIAAENNLSVENIALKARVSANSEFNEMYSAKFAVDGIIPDTNSQNNDYKHCWCVKNEIAKNHGEFTLQWDQPVNVAEIVYWGRTSFFLAECWKDYQVFLDNQTHPATIGTFQMKHGAQRINIPKQKVQKIKLVFNNSYGGQNPGAAEIMVFPNSPTNSELQKLSGIKSLETLADTDKEIQNHLTRNLKNFLVIKRFEIRSSHVYTYHYEGFHAGGGLYIFDCDELKKNQNAEGKLLVPTPEGQILDADLSYDGKTILFSWRRKKSEPYHLWTIQIDGSNLKQITSGAWHDYNACWLPDGDIAFLTSRSPQFAYCWNAPVGILHRMKLDGSQLIQLSGNYLNDFTPTILDDGRIIYGRWEYVDKPAIPIQSLWTIHPDGTQLQAFFGNRVLSPATFMEARQIPETSKIVCTMTGHNGITCGAIGIIDRQKGLNEQEAIQNITPEIPIGEVDKGDGNTWRVQKYSSPYPLDSERLLVSARGHLELRTFALDSKNHPLAAAIILPTPKNGMQYFNAIPIRSRKTPAVLPSQIPESNHPGYATITMLDVYQGLGSNVKRGEVATLRIVREMQKTVRIEPHLRAFGFQFPVISCGATYAGKMIIGDVPVAEDGSASFLIGDGITKTAKDYGTHIASKNPFDFPQSSPTSGPIYFIALDKEGRAIQRMRSFTHFMPGEEQTCVGCHESRLSSPPVSSKLAKTLTREPVIPTLPTWATTSAERASFAPGFDYVQVVQPVWNRYCVECHNPTNSPKNIDLSGGFTEYFNVSYDVLASEKQDKNGSPYISWIPTYNGDEQNILQIEPKSWGSYRSMLAELIRNGHPDANGKKRFEMDDESRRKIYTWIDLNVPYYASSETSRPESLGCRRIYPPELDVVLNEVGSRRCAGCHADGNVARKIWMNRTQNQYRFREENSNGIVPRRNWVRITEPELNQFLLSPLAKTAGGTERCGKIFADKNDPDYQKILSTFEPITQSIKQNPRIDMPNGKPKPNVCRLTD